VGIQPSADAIPGPVSARFGAKVAIVTGGGSGDGVAVSGVGAATSRLLAREGCRVAVLDADAAAANRTVERIKREGGDAFAIRGDVTLQDDCRRAVELARSTYGRLDVLVNSLGISLSRGSVTAISEDEWDRVMDVNVTGMMRMAKHAVPHMPSGGAIVNVSSVHAMRPAYESVVYSVSKGAVVALTLALAVSEAFRKIRVNCVCPGNIWTPMAIRRLRASHVDDLDAARDRRRLLNPLEIEGTAWDIAHATAFLASDQARWITGQTLIVDGGATVPGHGETRPTI